MSCKSVVLAILMALYYEQTESAVFNGRLTVADETGEIRTTSLENDSKYVTLKLDSLKEIASDGSEIGTIDSTPHSINDLSQTPFTLSPETDGGFYTGTSIPTTKFSLTADIVVDVTRNFVVTFTLELTVFEQSGFIEIDDDDVIIQGGDVRVDVVVENWPFCGANGLVCNNGIADVAGAFLDVGLNVMGTERAYLTQESTSVYMLGGRSSYRISNKVTYDGATTADLPQHTLVAGETGDIFSARLANFATSGQYFSIISLGRDDNFADNIAIDVKGKSGKMTISLKDNPSKNATVEFVNIQEKQANGDVIRTKGHAFNTFASQEFTISDLDLQAFQGVLVKQIQFSAQLSGTAATMTIHVYLFLEDGPINNHQETYAMKAGDVKFDLEIDNWEFCGTPQTTCKKGNTDLIGDFLDFEIIFKGLDETLRIIDVTGSAGGLQYDLGHTRLALSRQITVDGVGTIMEDGYPRLDVTDSMNIFQFRFPKFTTNMKYDPTYTVARYDKHINDGDQPTSLLALLVFSVLANIFK